jgi:hypothetical protein
MRKEWRKFKYTYKNPDFLRFLVSILGDKGVEAGVSFWPNEFFGELGQERSRFKKMHREEFMKNLEAYKQFLSKLKAKGIIPGWRLVFDYSFRQNNEPKIEKIYPYSKLENEGLTIDDEPHVTLVHPVNFINGKWEEIDLTNFLGEKSIRRLKEAVEFFSEKGYTLINVSGGLNPQPYTADHYVNGVDYDGHLFATGGIVEISGKLPEDFDFKKFVPGNLPVNQQSKMLEQLVKVE